MNKLEIIRELQDPDIPDNAEIEMTVGKEADNLTITYYPNDPKITIEGYKQHEPCRFVDDGKAS